MFRAGRRSVDSLGEEGLSTNRSRNTAGIRIVAVFDVCIEKFGAEAQRNAARQLHVLRALHAAPKGRWPGETRRRGWHGRKASERSLLGHQMSSRIVLA